MNVYINYHFNFGNTLLLDEQVENSIEITYLLKGLECLMNDVSAISLKETVFKLLMEYLLKHGDTSKKELKEVYALLDFLKLMGEVQGRMLEK